MSQKTTLTVTPSHVRKAGDVVEVWHDGRIVATVVPSPTECGFQVISRHEVKVENDWRTGQQVNVATVTIHPL